MYHVLLGRGQVLACSGHELLCPGPYCTELLVMFYIALNVLLGLVPLINEPWTLFYRAIDHVLEVCVTCATRLWTRST